MGHIRYSKSPWGAPVILAKKKDGTWRMCVNYKGLNKLTIRNSYPLPRSDDLIDRLQSARYFTKIDLRTGYHQIRVSEEDVSKTAFRTRYGHYEFRVLPFGLTDAPATFQQLMNDIFRDQLGDFVVVFLDDIMVYSNTFEDHVRHVQIVLDKLREYKLFAKLSKCDFFQKEITYLGHHISRSGVSIDKSKIEAVLNWPRPSNVKDVRSFLGFVGFLRRSLQNYSSYTAPFTDLLKGITRKSTKPIEWNASLEETFNKLKSLIVNAPTLAIPDPNQTFEVETDASDYAIGAALFQIGRPIAFESKKLDSAQRNYSVQEKELFAIIYALKKWRHYLYGSKFTVLTDHKSLQYFLSQKNFEGRKARWAELMQDFDFEIRYRKGALNSVADALSRIPEINALSFVEFNNDLFDLIRGKQKYLDDRTFSKFWKRAETGIDVDYGTTSTPKNLYYVANGLLYRNSKVCIPHIKDIKNKILYECHDAPSAGHPGVQRTLALIKARFFWPKMKPEVEAYVIRCPQCQVIKAERQKKAGLLQPLDIPAEKWQSISMDFIVGLPRSAEGNNAIWVVVDRLTKMARFIPTKSTITAKQLAIKFIKHLYSLYGLPMEIVSDRDSKFTSTFWSEVMQKLQTTLSLSSSDHPQSDGQTERVNQILEDMLRAYVAQKPSLWETYLPMVEFAYNSAKHTSTKYSPFMLMYGYTPRPPIDVSFDSHTLDSTKDFLSDMLEARKLAEENLRMAQDRNVFYANHDRKPRDFHVGQQVFLRVPKDSETLRTGPCAKLAPRYCGPYKVLKRIGPNAYRLDLPSNVMVHPVFHVSRLKEAIGYDDNVVPPSNLSTLEDDHFSPHEPEKILDHRARNLRSKVVHRYKVKWKDRLEEDNTWETEDTLRKHFPTFPLQECN